MAWKKGQSGNPRGRPPRGVTMTNALKRLLAKRDTDGRPWRDVVAQALVDAALAGNVSAIKEIYERLDGKVEQGQEVSGPEGSPVQVDFVIGVGYVDRLPASADNPELT